MSALSESVVEDAALDWLRELGYDVISGPDMPPGPNALRESYADVVFDSSLRGALDRLNPNLPSKALDDAFRKLTLSEGSTLAARNRAFHRMLVRGVTVEYRNLEGAVQGRLKRRSSISTIRKRMTGSRSISLPLSRTRTTAAPMWCCS